MGTYSPTLPNHETILCELKIMNLNSICRFPIGLVHVRNKRAPDNVMMWKLNIRSRWSHRHLIFFIFHNSFLKKKKNQKTTNPSIYFETVIFQLEKTILFNHGPHRNLLLSIIRSLVYRHDVWSRTRRMILLCGQDWCWRCFNLKKPEIIILPMLFYLLLNHTIVFVRSKPRIRHAQSNITNWKTRDRWIHYYKTY